MNILENKLSYFLITITAIICAIGLIMIFSTSSVVGLANYNDAYFFIKKHLIFLAIGILALIIGYNIPHQEYKKIAFWGLFISNILLFLTFIPPFGVSIAGASRWLNLHFINFQPVEFAKFFWAIFLASYLSNKHYNLPNFQKGILPLLLIISITIALLIKQPDLGNSLLILAVTFILIFISNTKISHLLSLALLGLLSISIIIYFHPYQQARIKSFLNPYEDPSGRNYHMLQSLTAIGSGGPFGVGIGHSKLKNFYLPLHYSDFIFSILCEEGGLFLSSGTIFLFFLLFVAGTKIALRSKNKFSFYLAIALTLFIVLQAIINIGVVIGVIPVTGIPLTLISFGGTSLISSLFFIGVLLNISKKIS